jgi:hypothetical protein
MKIALLMLLISVIAAVGHVSDRRNWADEKDRS